MVVPDPHERPSSSYNFPRRLASRRSRIERCAYTADGSRYALPGHACLPEAAGLPVDAGRMDGVACGGGNCRRRSGSAPAKPLECLGFRSRGLGTFSAGGARAADSAGPRDVGSHTATRSLSGAGRRAAFLRKAFAGRLRTLHGPFVPYANAGVGPRSGAAARRGDTDRRDQRGNGVPVTRRVAVARGLGEGLGGVFIRGNFRGAPGAAGRTGFAPSCSARREPNRRGAAHKSEGGRRLMSFCATSGPTLPAMLLMHVAKLNYLWRAAGKVRT